MIESWDDMRAYANGIRDGSTIVERSRFCAAQALTAFVDIAGEDEFAESITDLVADLLHLCELVDVDVDEVLARAHYHYELDLNEDMS